MSAIIDTLETVRSITQTGYKWGFETDIEMELAPKGLNENIIRLISARKNEPDWLLAWRLEAFAGWKTMEEPHWARVDHPPIDYQNLPTTKICTTSLRQSAGRDRAAWTRSIPSCCGRMRSSAFR